MWLVSVMLIQESEKKKSLFKKKRGYHKLAEKNRKLNKVIFVPN